MRWIYLSPHLDDAIFSCGGWIWYQTREGTEVEIWTLCAGDPPEEPLSAYAQQLHQRWQTSLNAIAARRQEDLEACARVGAIPRHFPLPDCIYRRDPQHNHPIVNSDEDLFQPTLPASERLWVATVREWLTTALSGPSILVCPLGLGGHIDHHLTRAAAEGLGHPALWYYADFPYALRNCNESMRPVSTHGPYPLELPAEALEAWVEAIACYRSQLSTFWPDFAALNRELRHYYQNCKGQILWRPL
ncbi:PIG-L family deacetylase [uncultured Thermanaerothrix sp.]|uniref:PIG-L deacetylase family protein n=1 Tax=uncultured Thermanaerothrix sp. TaxID=1195149 RepID=UPI00260322EC|nr:PIG-L family deacetylase [uncultured Thermanaerothrix sp.]